MSEHDEQVKLFDWALMQAGKYPELDLLYAVPNEGKRSYALANYMKQQGLKAGVPDIFLPVSRSEYHGLYIEMKYGKNKNDNDNQLWWQKQLKKQGFLVWVSYSFEDAKEVILAYLKNKVLHVQV